MTENTNQNNETNIALADENESFFTGLPSEILKDLTPAKNRMILLYLTGQYTKAKIAQILGVSQNTIQLWLNNPNVMTVIKELQKREFDIIDSNLKSMRNKAMNALDELLESPNEQVKFQAAKDVLDRTGHKAMQQIKVDKTVTTIEEQLSKIADITIDDAEVIDISDVVTELKGEYNERYGE